MATQTVDFLLTQYGPLLSLDELAKILKRSRDGIRVQLYTSKDDYAKRLVAAKVNIGRRVYFRTNEVAQIIENG